MAVDVQKLNGSNSIKLLCYIWADVLRLPPQTPSREPLAVIPPIPQTELNSLANGRRVYELYADSL
jgi:hypothetical protein